jgi:hypothetical protein
MPINLKSIEQLFGFAMKSAEAKRVLSENGFVAEYSTKKLKQLGTVHLVSEPRGIELAFSERSAFIENYGDPKTEGDAILSSIFVYPIGTKTYSKFVDPIGHGIDGCVTRADALRALGKPNATEEDDGVVEWDQWVLSDKILRATYQDDLSIYFWYISGLRIQT